MIDVMDVRQKTKDEVITENFLYASMGGTQDSRNSRLKCWNRQGKLLRLRRGVYAFGEKYRKKSINLYSAAQLIYGPSYISFESALSYHGIIPEAVYSVTSASMDRAKDFRTPVGVFSYRPVNSNVFLAGVKRETEGREVFLIASPFRALADIMYARGKKWKNPEDAAEDLRLDTEEITSDDVSLIDEIKDSFSKRRIREFLDKCRKEFGA